MRIGFDAKRATHNYTGLGNYSRSLIKNLSEKFPSNEYLLYSPSFDSKNPQLSFLKQRENISIKTPASVFGRTFKASWRSIGLGTQLRKDKIDIYHGLSHELPLNIRIAEIKSVVTVHDLIFMRFPQFYNYIDRKIYKNKLIHSCKMANKIIAISEQTKQDLIDFLEVDKNKIEVVYQSCNPLFKVEATAAEKEKIAKKYGLPKQYILNVGTIEDRKNLISVVKAMNKLKDKRPELQLVVVGGFTNYVYKVKQLIREFGLHDRVVFLQNVSYKDLPAIYQMADVFIYPSLFEGFGLPIIEALNSKVPVITSKGGCFPEAGGPSSAYVNSTNSTEIAEAIERILDDETLRKKMIADGYQYAQNFNDDVIAKRMMEVYQSVLE
jgi:glycosyltransferase involved in cell wall biosynthesis